MNNLLSKFNLYEFFRIILPGAYLLFLFIFPSKEVFISYFSLIHWSVSILIITFSSFLLGALVYALDIARLFRTRIQFLPTNLMSIEFPSLYPESKILENEHDYYQWYEKSGNKSKSKTELQSSLYHFALNICFCSIFGSVVGGYVLLKSNDSILIILNLALFICSALSAYIIVKVRLRYQWQRNYWEFRYEVIQKLPEQDVRE